MVKMKKCKTNRNYIRLLVILAGITTICAVVCVIVVTGYNANLAASQQELAALPVLPETPRIVWGTLERYNKDMLAINPDYSGVLRIEGTTISYPVVRGEDNIKYLDTSFAGSANPFGGLFMDYRCTSPDIPHIIIYGHHSSGGGKRVMFGNLDVFLNEQYRTEHSQVTLVENEHLFEYEIFSARVSDINDPAYFLDFRTEGDFPAFLERNGAPPDANQILTLSTCYGDGTDDRRIIVQGALKGVIPINKSGMMIASYDYQRKV